MNRWTGMRFDPMQYAGLRAASGLDQSLPSSGGITRPTSGRTRQSVDRDREIRRILDARFSLSALEQFRNDDPAGWSAPRNDMGRGFYGEAIREERRLQAVSAEELAAEAAAVELP